MGNLEPLLRLVPPIVAAMIARRDRTFVEVANVEQRIPLIRAEKHAFIKLLAREAELQSGGKFSVKEISSSYFHNTKFRTAALHVVLCSTKYKRIENRSIALPASDESLYAVAASASPRQGLLVARVGLKKKRR